MRPRTVKGGGGERGQAGGVPLGGLPRHGRVRLAHQAQGQGQVRSIS